MKIEPHMSLYLAEVLFFSSWPRPEQHVQVGPEKLVQQLQIDARVIKPEMLQMLMNFKRE